MRVNNIDLAQEWAAAAWTRFDLEPPCDLHKVRKALKLFVRREDMDGEDSHLLATPKRWYVILNRQHSYERRRFSMAHEIGEFLLVRYAAKHRDIRILDNKELKERFCDRFAVHLLMPEAQVVKHAKAVYHSVTNDKTSVLARRFEVSESAMSIRLRELGLFSTSKASPYE